jgi:hypothetical protein
MPVEAWQLDKTQNLVQELLPEGGSFIFFKM